MSAVRVSDYHPGVLNAHVLVVMRKCHQFMFSYQSDKSARRIIFAVLAANCCLIGVHVVLNLVAYFGSYADLRDHREFMITTEGGYPEIFNYLQLAVLAWLMLQIFVGTRSAIYAVLGIIFLFALGDDALPLHERVGRYAVSIDLPAPAFLGAQHLGEALYWLVVGALSVAALVYGFVASGAEDRKIGAIFVLLIVILGFFAGFVDAVHVVLNGKFFASDFILGVVEDGGEMLTIALAVSAALLLYRHLDDLRRPPSRGVRSRPPP